MVLLVAALVLIVSRVELPGWEITEVDSAAGTAESAETGIYGVRERPAISVGALVRRAVPQTLFAEALARSAVPQPLIGESPAVRISDPMTYTVSVGDTLWSIADKHNISVETLMWANAMEQNPDLLRLGQQLIVLPVSGVLHTVARGDTVESIAKKYKARPEDIIALPGNHIDPKNPTLPLGARVIVPGGSRAMPKPKPLPKIQASQYAKAPANAPVGSTRFAWPTRGTITTRYRAYHPGIDIATNYGTPVAASDAGYVASVIYSRTGYGTHIIVDHGNGFQTLYAHLSKVYVAAGDRVSQGQAIGGVGSTGNSTGPHLHFEVRQGGVQRNPFSYLP